MKNALKLILLFGATPDEDDMAIPKRLMLFIDGENLVMRYQDMISHGFVTREDNIFYKKDTFLWSSNIPLPTPNPKLTNIDIVRAYYYTCVAGGIEKQEEIENVIRKTELPRTSTLGNSQMLFPVVYKKSRQNVKAKGVDIRMTIDILSHTYNNNLDTVCFFTCDGDFEPVMKEVVDEGKNILLYSFSAGLNKNLLKVCDQHFCLDEYFFDLSKSSKIEV
jgi:uncharacterized LabA/DUF88 family protein